MTANFEKRALILSLILSIHPLGKDFHEIIKSLEQMLLRVDEGTHGLALRAEALRSVNRHKEETVDKNDASPPKNIRKKKVLGHSL